MTSIDHRATAPEDRGFQLPKSPRMPSVRWSNGCQEAQRLVDVVLSRARRPLLVSGGLHPQL